MNVLVLGGTVFLGRHVVAALLARGHVPTLFNRGRSAPDAFPGVEQLRGDRSAGAEGLAALAGQRWDAVVDCCGYVPRVVGASTARLRDAVGRYVFISTISVYRDFSRPGIDEDAPVAELDDPTTEDVPAHYGALKAACERVVADAFGERASIVRPGLIVGPHDPTGRFTYWVERAERGGEILAPEGGALPVQFIDVRDLAAWIVTLLERDVGGTFNATDAGSTLGALLDACIAAAGTADRACVTYVAADFLQGHGVAPWTGLPLWVTADDIGIHRISIDRARAAGLAWRPLAGTVADTLRWSRDVRAAGGTTTASRFGRVGPTPEREAELLAAWHARAAS